MEFERKNVFRAASEQKHEDAVQSEPTYRQYFLEEDSPSAKNSSY
jgi:hypothetical protein